MDKDNKRSTAKLALQIGLPLALVAIGVGMAGHLSSLAPPPAPKDTSVAPPTMSLLKVSKGATAITVPVNGTVRPVTEADLTAQVGGRVEYISPKLIAGGMFESGEVLVRIESADYHTATLEAAAMKAGADARLASAKAETERLKVQRSSAEIAAQSSEAGISVAESEIAGAQAAVAAADAEIGRAASEVSRASAAVASAQAALTTEEALSRLAREEWEKYGEGREPSDLVLRKPQLAQATATLDSAKSALDAAQKLDASARAGKAGAEAALSGARKRLEMSRLARDNAVKGVELADRVLEAAAAAVKMAEADIAAADAAIARAALNLSRVEIKAPFNGRVVSKHVGLGQQLPMGAMLARIQGTDLAEIELPVPADEIPFLDLPMGKAMEGAEAKQVAIEARVGSSIQHWTGTLHRTGAQITTDSRVLPVMVRVANPLNSSSQPLMFGTFVTCTLTGKPMGGMVRLPRRTVRPGAPASVEAAQPAPADGSQTAWILVATPTPVPTGADAKGNYVKLNLRRVTLARTEGREIVVAAGLADGEMVADTAIEVVTENMIARVGG